MKIIKKIGIFLMFISFGFMYALVSLFSLKKAIELHKHNSDLM